MDVSGSFPPNSEQLTYPEIGDRIVVVTVAKVVPRKDRPSDPAIHFEEFPGKPLLPGANVGSLIREAWGNDTKVWLGRRMELYGDPDVYFGPDKLGGVRVSRLSHITRPVSAPRRGKGARGKNTVQPLAESAPTQAELNVSECDSIPDLREAWKYADPAQKKRIEARVKELEKRAFEDDARADMRDEAEAQDTLDNHGALDA